MTDARKTPVLPDPADLEVRASRLHAAVHASDRPYMVEVLGLPKSGKSTTITIMRDFFRRNGYEVAAPQEGAQAVLLPRIEPGINYAYTEYALMHARDIAASRKVDVGLFDRAIWDGVVRMEYYGYEGQLTDEQCRNSVGYYLLPWHRAIFDAHIFLMADPVVALQRKQALLVSKRHGGTTNPKKMQELFAAHERTWKDHGLGNDPKMAWIDTTSIDPMETALLAIDFVLSAFKRRILPP